MRPDGDDGLDPLSASQGLGTALTGRLPCVVCGYDLKGLTIRGRCPECGTAVRAAILYQVDPQAEEFRPMVTPKLTAWCLVIWGVAALASAVSAWVPRVGDAISQFAGRAPGMGAWAWVTVGGASVSGLAVIGLICVVRGGPTGHKLMALAALAAYAPLVWALHRIHLGIDRLGGTPYFGGTVDTQRVGLRLIVAASVVVIILGIRPNARDLVRRSLALRTGRVDRQTLIALGLTMVITASGDVLRLSAVWMGADWRMAETLGTLLIALASGLFALGLIGAVVDSWRIRQAILLPSPSLRQVLGGQAGQPLAAPPAPAAARAGRA